ncbi:MAG: PQQ-binding-like beta-propeller repeat protein, partial [Clostridia bacterium]|nr:PQQ-binding-like beta-propeller repeat protein [Clostridia bacterium]
ARMSSVRTDLGFSNLSEHYLSRARENGLQAIEDAGGLYDRRAEKLLLDALNAYQMDEKRGDVVFEQEESIVGLETVENGDLAVTLDRTGAITCVDAAGGREIWRYIVPEQSVDTGFSVVDTGKMKVYSELLPTVTEGIVIYKDYAGLIALSLKDGSEVWTYEYAVSEGWNKMYTNYSCNSFRALSEDGRLLAVLDREDPEDPGVEMVILDAATGAEKGRVHLDFEAGKKACVWYNQAGAFTEDGSAVACALCAAEGYRYFAVDLETMKVIDAYAAADMDCSVAYGVRYDRASGELFAAQLQPRRGGIVVTIFRRNGKHFSKLTYHTISTDVGKYYDTSEYAAFLQPMLVRGDEAAVMSDEIVLFFNLKTGELLNSCDISGRIVDSCWTEDEKQTLYLLADNGAMLAYRYREGSISQSWFMPSDVSGIGLGRLYKNGFQNDAQPLKFVSVPSDHDARLVAVSLVSDPTRKLLEPAVSLEDVFEFTARFLLSPSAERLFIFRDTRNGTCAVTCYDVQTMTLVSSMTVEEQNKANPAVIDEEHFLYGGVIYGLDGSERRLASSDGKDFSESCFSSIRLSDGSLLTWYGDSIVKDDTAKTVPPYIWLDGEEAVLPEAGKALALEDDTPCYAGGNGLMILNGNAVADGSKKAYFVVYDVHRKTTRYIRDESPAAESFFAAVGTEKPFFASIYDGKRIVFYDMEEESFRAWEGEYQEDEIIRAAFTRGDEYLLILTRKGVLRCYDTATGKPVWSGTVIEELQYIENVNSIEGCILPDGRLAFVSCRENSSEIVIVDMEYDVVLAKISGTVKILLEIGKILYVQREKTCSFDLHTLDGLLRMARESLG